MASVVSSLGTPGFGLRGGSAGRRCFEKAQDVHGVVEAVSAYFRGGGEVAAHRRSLRVDAAGVVGAKVGAPDSPGLAVRHPREGGRYRRRDAAGAAQSAGGSGCAV